MVLFCGPQIIIFNLVQDLHDRGRIQEFKIEGAQKMCSAHHKREDRNPFNSAGVHRARFIDTGSFKILDALLCYLRLILKHSDTKLKKTKHSQSGFRGRARLLRPLLDPLLMIYFHWLYHF